MTSTQAMSARLVLLAAAVAALALACDRDEGGEPVAAHEPEPTPITPAETVDPANAATATTDASPPGDDSPLVAQGPTMPADSTTPSPLLRESGNRVEDVAEQLARERYAERLQIEHLVSRGEVREVTGYTGTLARAELEGQAASETYNAFRLAAEDTYGFGLQVWKFEDANRASDYFDRLQETYVVTGDTRVGDTTAFEADLAGIRQLVFVAPRQGSVVAVSCDETVCTAPEPLMALAERVYNRL